MEEYVFQETTVGQLGNSSVALSGTAKGTRPKQAGRVKYVHLTIDGQQQYQYATEGTQFEAGGHQWQIARIKVGRWWRGKGEVMFRKVE